VYACLGNWAKPAIPPSVDFLEACSIEDKESGELIPFALWDAQVELAGLLESEDRLLALKSRQLGFTWTALGHMLRLGEFWGNRLFLILSQSGDDSAAAIQRLKIMHGSLPAEWRQRIAVDNVTALAFANGSRYIALKATRRAGRSHAAYATLCDELDFWEWPDEQLTAVEPGSQRLYIVTTGDGPGSFVHGMWQRACAAESSYRAVFFPWTADPRRDEEWYRRHVELANEPRRAKREYAATPEDAFASPAGCFFERWSERNHKKLHAQSGLKTVRAVDFGFRHPAVLWIQRLPSGQPVVVREFVPAFHEASAALTTEELAGRIREIDAELGVAPSVSYCDPAGRAAGAQTGESEFEVLQQAGLYPDGKPSGIRDGCVALLGLIADPDIPLVVSDDCPCLLEAITSVQPDKTRPDLYDQRESSPYQHVLDALRYWAINESLGATDWYISTSMTGKRVV
jgi:hypothetical protein